MFASIRYINTHHAASSIPEQQFPIHFPGQTPLNTNTNTETNTNTNTSDDNDEIARPDTPTTFLSALHELARDLVTKEQQIEFLINNLPGRGRTVEEQERRTRDLDAELRTLETEVERAEKERRGMLERVEGVIMGVRRW